MNITFGLNKFINIYLRESLFDNRGIIVRYFDFELIYTVSSKRDRFT